ncbi:hypothetical protein DMB66_02460 [Actinoplanes sp. ATCC 53533]|uniref:hypothetical protein n=1 Tax=Actinoplanes sp. ATCC 53533 TaxID=1288362 RepID=UPI000F772204|nr:hypothetical protein [Actinoplanes sp. ATCC 53533]RSM73786.1 hypothetical protein DMB66_02460 [Actinoplanes sp. ATCC 53533]
MKRLASVETLGSTSQICTDKTGTLTLNQMTAREMLLAGRRFTASGEGYQTDGRIRTTDGSPLPGTLNHALLAMALCSDAVLRDGDVVGDPTEGALVVLAEKGGIDVAALRAERPRILEIPFDSDYKFMATFHRWTDDQHEEVVRCFVKGAPDVLSARADRYLGESAVVAFDAAAQTRYEQANGGAGRAGHAGDGCRRGGLPGRRIRPGPRSEGHARPAGARRPRRYRRPAASRSAPGHRRVSRRRYPGADDHR